MSKQKKIPIILDTDIGGDIDDTWAVTQLLKCPQLDTKLITVGAGNTPYRVKVLARLLQKSKRSDVPIGVGLEHKWHYIHNFFNELVDEVNLADYPGELYTDGVDAMINTIMNSPEPVTVIGIGPVPNLAEAVYREPRIVNNSRLILMSGRINGTNKFGMKTECNLSSFPQASEYVYASDWDMTIVPIDCAPETVIDGEYYQRLKRSDDPAIQTMLGDYYHWQQQYPSGHLIYPSITSSGLIDTVAIYLAYAEDYLKMEPIKLKVNKNGELIRDKAGKTINVATAWRDIDGFKRELTEILCSKNA
jgi:inosine-uridine nucleoside N-ribohydrolase